MLKNWITYYIFLLASLVFALLYPGRVSSAFFYALLLMPIVSLCLSALLLKGFRYEQFMDKMTATKGDTVLFRIIARNKAVLMLPYVELSFYGSGPILENDFKTRCIAISPMNKTTLEIKIPCKYKGAFEIGIKQVKFRDYLGLFTFKQNIKKLGELVVYPRIIPISSFPVVVGNAGDSSAHTGRSHEKTENISDIRKYSSGDRLRSIHWKLSAKKEQLMVKNFENASGECVDIVLDASGIQGSLATKIYVEDKLVECAVSLAYYFTSHSIPAVLYYSCHRLSRQRLGNLHDFQPAYRTLSEVEFTSDSALPDFAERILEEGAKQKTAVIITADLSLALCGQSLRLRSSGSRVIIIQVSTGEKFPDSTISTEELKTSLLGAGVLLYSVDVDADISSVLTPRAI